MRHRTTCNRDCPDACALLVDVEDGRVQALHGDPDHPITRGFLCPRTNRFLHRQYHPTRLREPLLRRGDRQVPIPLSDALDLAAEHLLRIRRESGPAAIFAYRLGGSLGLLKEVTDLFFDRFGPVTTKSGDVCSAAGEAAQERDFGVLDAHDPLDLLNARHILNWGRNPVVSSVHLVPVLKEARRRGATITLIDPVHTASVGLADHFLPVRPGGDPALALAVARRLFETGRVRTEGCDPVDAFRDLVFVRPLDSLLSRCDLPIAEVDRLADLLSDGPTAILVGWGLQRRSSGAACVRLLDALGAISGNLGVPGGGVSFTTMRRRAFNVSFVQKSAPPRTICEPRFGVEVLAATDPEIRFLWVSCANPVVTLPDAATVARAIETREFSVVVDSHETDTTRRATLVLPTTTMLEDDDLLGSYGHHWLGASHPVIPPPDGVLTDLGLLQELARRVGLEADLNGSVQDWKRRFLDGSGPISADDLDAGPRRYPAPDVLPIPRVDLVRDLPPEPAVDADFPLWLFSSSHPLSQASQYAMDLSDDAMEATLHPDAAHGVPDGGIARIRSPHGAMWVRLVHDPRQRRDVIVVPKGGAFDRGQAVNALIPPVLTDDGEGAAYLDARVRVET